MSYICYAYVSSTYFTDILNRSLCVQVWCLFYWTSQTNAKNLKLLHNQRLSLTSKSNVLHHYISSLSLVADAHFDTWYEGSILKYSQLMKDKYHEWGQEKLKIVIIPCTNSSISDHLFSNNLKQSFTTVARGPFLIGRSKEQ